MLGGVGAYLVALRRRAITIAAIPPISPFTMLAYIPNSPRFLKMFFLLLAVVLVRVRRDLGASAHVLVLPEPQVVGPVGGKGACHVVVREAVARVVAQLV